VGDWHLSVPKCPEMSRIVSCREPTRPVISPVKSARQGGSRRSLQKRLPVTLPLYEASILSDVTAFILGFNRLQRGIKCIVLRPREV